MTDIPEAAHRARQMYADGAPTRAILAETKLSLHSFYNWVNGRASSKAQPVLLPLPKRRTVRHLRIDPGDRRSLVERMMRSAERQVACGWRMGCLRPRPPARTRVETGINVAGTSLHAIFEDDMDPIASRTLTLRHAGREIPVAVKVYTPRLVDRGAFGCRYTINWPDKPVDRDMLGVDSLQALVLTLQTVGAEIYASSFHKAGLLRWETVGDGYGLPVVPTLRELLQGSDAQFF